MKKIIILALMMATTGVFSQVGIGTTSPHASAVLDLTATDKGFLLPRVANTAAIPAPTNGMIIYDLSANCIKFYENGAWTAYLSASSGTTPFVTANCNANGFVGSFVSGMALSGASFSVTLTNNSFSTATITFAAADLVLSGTTGLTVGTPTGSPALSAGVATINPGASVVVTYPITGTPGSTGTLTGTWTKVSLNCVKTKTVTSLSGSFANNYCDSAVFGSPMISGVAITGKTFAITITNTSGSTINGLPAPAIGNLALSYSGTASPALSVTAVSPSATFNIANGASQTITYTLAGTPTSVGTLTGVWNYGGDFTCTQTKPIGLGDATFTLPQSKYAVSIYDGTPITDVQGYITNTAPNQFVINVPYTGGSGSYSAYTSSVVTGAAGQGGDVNGFSISYPAGTFSATGTIPVTVTVDGDGTYSAKKQLFGGQETIVTLPFLLNGDPRGNIILGAVGGILDRSFEQTINGANNHNFVYLPVTGADGKTWLNHNLGAHYTNRNHASFNPAQQATSATDYLAYGSLFQWGRKADGHELITWTTSTTGTAVNGTTATLSTAPTHALFITNSGFTPFDWRGAHDNTLWATQASANNPCPTGYRVPTEAELTALVTAAGITNTATAASTSLKFTAAGQRSNNDGLLYNMVSDGNYWSSSVSSVYASYRNFSSSGTSTPIGYRGKGFSVRCIKD